ncbi:AraC family transcriptional regulator [Saccharospirillum mangrovi]|uniref:AraC family transcriptional regulator n=1 Tax=Saccharospirillum mangrovi TaxID=2161747 RepID=UPI000D344D87|nr:AraC family transcriptional regulator [Saccharospirillum mangrovi]
MADRLEALLNRFNVHASLFHSGRVCGAHTLPVSDGLGQLHLIKSGRLKVQHDDLPELDIREPSLLLYPRSRSRRFITHDDEPAELVCADLHFEGGTSNPLTDALPAVSLIPLSSLFGSDALLSLLFEEAFDERCGRQALISRLFEAVMIQVLRYLMEGEALNSGMLAGMAHPKLRHALIAMHEAPAQPWSLDSLSEQARMSRSVFANAFKDVVGMTMGAYLQSWRIRLAQQSLRKDRSLAAIANEVGYSGEAALSRAFKVQCGMSPREWRRSLG